MLHFLSMLSPRHPDALRPASTVRRAPAADLPSFLPAGGDEGTDTAPTVAAPSPRSLRERQVPAAAAPQAPATGRDEPMRRVGSPAAPGARAPFASATPDAAPPAERAAPRTLPGPAPTPFVPTRHQVDSAAPPALRSPGSPATPGSEPGPPHPALSATTLALYRPPTAEAPATTLHVHIGRIEVRAAPLAKPATPRARPTPPAQSLGEYLRGQRAETP